MTLPIAADEILHSGDYKIEGVDCPACNFRKYLEVRSRLGSEKATEHIYDQQEPDPAA